MKKPLFLKQAITLCLGLIFMASVQAGGVRDRDEEGNNLDWTPTGQGHGKPDNNAPHRSEPNNPGNGNARITGRIPTPTATGYGIYYHGGPVMGGTTNVYYIWYGNWSGDTAPAILENLAQNIGGSPYFNINTTYSTSATQIVNSVAYKGSTTDNYSQGTTLSDTSVGSVVANAINSGRLPKDSNGVYFVLTSKDVKESSGFCTTYCGWHSAGTLGATTIKYAFVGDGSQQCPNSCSVQASVSPNGNPGADAMASVVTHELEESVTDPTLRAWYDNSGMENADKCAWTFGSTFAAPNGSRANVQLGSSDFLIQQNWVNAQNGTLNGFCALSH